VVRRLQGRVHARQPALLQPLTLTDFASRYLLTCEALTTTQEQFAFTAFEHTFKEFGLPAAIRTDNGVPFASGHALYGLSRLSVWWLRLGIQIERIQPGQPQQNGRHERMHLTLKREATKPAAANVLQQQARFDAFVDRRRAAPSETRPPRRRAASRPIGNGFAGNRSDGSCRDAERPAAGVPLRVEPQFRRCVP
jgi:transposase InsO family protein